MLVNEIYFLRALPIASTWADPVSMAESQLLIWFCVFLSKKKNNLQLEYTLKAKDEQYGP